MFRVRLTNGLCVGDEMQTETEEVKAAKKAHQCSWCGKKIDVGQPYMRYRWFGDDGVSTVKEHPECYEAMNELIDFDGEVLFSPGDNPRGCNCGHDHGCERCEANKAQTHNVQYAP